MTGFPIETILREAERSCEEAGARLTSKRKNVLLSLLTSGSAVSAYELADRYRTQFAEPIQMMSLYRMLDFLIQENLVHKLVTTNKYVACSHIACEHAHDIPQFLICDTCNGVQEVAVKKEIIEGLQASVASVGFILGSPQLELHGACALCQTGKVGASRRDA